MLKENVIEFFGGIAKLNRATNIPRQAVYEWGTQVPEQRVKTIQEAVKKELKEKQSLAKVLLNGRTGKNP